MGWAIDRSLRVSQGTAKMITGLKKAHLLRCARPISRQRTRVRLRSSIFARLASGHFLNSLGQQGLSCSWFVFMLV
jgi:hypothetical protein